MDREGSLCLFRLSLPLSQKRSCCCGCFRKVTEAQGFGGIQLGWTKKMPPRAPRQPQSLCHLHGRPGRQPVRTTGCCADARSTVSADWLSSTKPPSPLGQSHFVATPPDSGVRGFQKPILNWSFWGLFVENWSNRRILIKPISFLV